MSAPAVFVPEYQASPAGVAAGQAEAWLRRDGSANDVVQWLDVEGAVSMESIRLSSHSALRLAKDEEFNLRHGFGNAVGSVRLVLGSGRVLDMVAIKEARF